MDNIDDIFPVKPMNIIDLRKTEGSDTKITAYDEGAFAKFDKKKFENALKKQKIGKKLPKDLFTLYMLSAYDDKWKGDFTAGHQYQLRNELLLAYRSHDLPHLSKRLFRSEDATIFGEITSREPRWREMAPSQVNVSSLLMKGSLVFGFICTGSLIAWSSSNTILLNPFISLLFLLSCPFTYWMGKKLSSQ